MRKLATIALFLGFIALLSDHVAHSQVCVTQFGPSEATGADLQGYIATDASSDPDALTTGYGEGVEWNGTGVVLEKEGGSFGSIALGDPGFGMRIRVAAAGDFDGDGWEDLIIGDRGASSGSIPQYLRLLKNETAASAPPSNWNDPTQVRTPQFSFPYASFGVQFVSCSVAIAAADFDRDGDLDVARAFCNGSTDAIAGVQVFVNPGDGNFPSTASWTFHSGTGLGGIHASATGLVATDYNGDGFPDLIVGGSNGAASSGEVKVLLNPGCATPPCTPPYGTATAQTLLSGIGTGTDGLASIAIGDFTGDGNLDIVGGAPDQTWLKLWVADGAGGFNPGVNLAPGVAAHAQTLVAHDFNLDGSLDLFFGVDSAAFANDGDGYVMYGDEDSSPLDDPAVKIFDHPGPNLDLDGGALVNYDNDPQGTLDIFIGDGQSTGNAYHLLANRVKSNVVDCGEVVSAPIDMSSVSPDDFVIESVRLSALLLKDNSQLDSQIPCNGTKACVNFYASNATPPNWVLAVPCASGPANDRCANLNPNEGREVRWKAVMCSNAGNASNVPELRGLSTKIDYQPGTQSFRAGVVVHQGSVYAGGLREPGARGRFYAFDADFSNFDSPTWEASSIVDGQGASRKIFTTDTSGTVLIPLDSSAAAAMVPARDADLRASLSVATNTEVDSLRSWFVSTRFGNSLEATSLGAVNNSTAAILGAPGLPLYYAFLPATDAGADRAKADAFINANADRYELAFFGSKDGALHAFSAVASPEGGSAGSAKEKWAFVSREVAANLAADRAAWPTSNPHYPDGSPTLLDFHDASGNFKTALVAGSGDGGESFFALDVTATVESTTPYNVIEPTPLWSRTVPNPGPAQSKAVVIRTLLPNAQPPSSATSATTQFLTVMATGYDAAAPTNGRVVVAVDLETGAEQWRFEAKCPVTSDLVAFETDDTAEPVAPFVAPGGNGETIDGYIDRVVFADNCGYVYKIDPTLRPTAPNLYIPSMTGPITGATTDPEGNANDALFWAGNDSVIAAGSTSDRPIVGTIAARPDSSTRVTLFFGTGGSEDVDPGLPNNFFGVYADDGTVRTRLYDDATDPTQVGCAPICKKFYGGVLVTESQVAVTASIDPVTSDPCDDGEAEVLVFSIDDVGSDGLFDQEATSGVLDSGSVSGIFGGQGAIYITLLDGSIAQMGQPTQANPSAPNPGQGVGSGDAYLKGDIIAVSGWRQVLY